MFTLKSIDFKRVYLSREGALQDWNDLGASTVSCKGVQRAGSSPSPAAVLRAALRWQ